MLITSGELFTAALRKCGGIVASGETAPADLMEDCRMAFNLMLDSWSAESLSIFASQDQIVTWPANQASQTIGATGDLGTERPTQVLDSSYFKDLASGISYNLGIINEVQYNSLALKTASSTYPQYLWVNPTMPDTTLTVYPIPTTNLEFHIISPQALTQVDDLFTDIILPPGYQRALVFNLACEVCVELGLEPPRTTQRLAMASKRVIKSANSSDDKLRMPYGILRTPHRYNIFSGDC